jgi:putative protease
MVTKKTTAKKPAVKKAAPKAPAAPKQAAKKLVGKIAHFYPKISVAVVEVAAPLAKGAKISIEGHGKAFEQTVGSMQIEHEQVAVAKKGQSIGMKVSQEVKEGDLVYLA